MRLPIITVAVLFFAAGTVRSLARGEPVAGSAHGPSGVFNAETAAEPNLAPAKSDLAARLPLASPAPSNATDRGKRTAWLNLQAGKSLTRVMTGLSIVLGGFLLLAWVVRKRLPRGSARLPDEIIEVLGRTTLAAKQSLHLVRVGGKLIVVSVTAAGTKTLTEITDPDEVARILAACQQQQTYSSTAAFRQVFEQFGREGASGFLGPSSDASGADRSSTRAA